MAIPPDIRIRLEQLRGEMAAKAEAQRRQQQAQANAEKMSKQFVPGKAKGGKADPIEELRQQLGPREPFDPIGNLQRNVTGALQVLKNVPGNLQRLATDPMAYIRSLPAPTGEQIMNMAGPGNIGFAGMMIGPKARTWHTGRAEMAKAMEEAGRTPAEIWKATGTLKGPDGIWRQEISDKGSSFNMIDDLKQKAQEYKAMVEGKQELLRPDRSGQKDFWPKTLTEAKKPVRAEIAALKEEMRQMSQNPRTQGVPARYTLEHPELYAAYPELADLPVIQNYKTGPEKGSLYTGGGKLMNMEVNDPRMPRSIALHEMQHAIQNIEGMTPGANPMMALGKPEWKAMYDAYKKAELEGMPPGSTLPTKVEDQIAQKAAMRWYQRQHGEAEARATQARRDMTDAERAESFPYNSYDVSPSDFLTKDPIPYTGKAKGGEVKQPSLDAMKLALTQKGGVLPKEEHDENLRKFLEQSHIKDRLYHATPGNFSEFKPGGKDPTLSGPAIWLSPDPTQQPAAHNIGGGNRGFKEGTNVMPVHVQAKRPLVLDDPTMIEWAREVFANGSSEFPDLLAPKTVEEIKKEGYDSIIHADPYNTGRLHEVIMFEPNKIKSATANRGTFDTSTPDITKAEGGKVQPSVAQMKLALNKQGMYSPLEKAAMSIPRTKGTPAEFMAEISKQPGFRKDEVEDRKISLPEGKMTKQEFLEHVQKNHPSPRLDEQIYHSEDEDEGDQTKYGEYQLPGGQNYREVLLKTPTFSPAKDHQIMELEANIRRMNPDDYPPGYVQNMIDGVNKLKAEKAAMGNPYQSSHWRDDPNVLAHMRLSDRYVGDAGKFAVMGTKNGKTRWLFTTGINGTPEQAQEAAKKWEDQGYTTSINQVGGGKKLLHIEEIQSDWHQQGRKEGYYTPEQRQELKDAMREWKSGREGALFNGPDQFAKEHPEYAWMNRAAPDAPFKKNWHELALKHALNIAAKGGYDGIVITPGQQQAERYDLSQHVDRVEYFPESGNLVAMREGKPVITENITSDKLDNYLGKEAANKLLSQPPVQAQRIGESSMHLLEGQDLKVGGEGMKGFYDKIVPTYLNKLGKPHGAQVGKINLQTTGMPISEYDKYPEDHPYRQKNYPSVHYFPITDSMRQQIKNEGLPQYEQGGKVKGLDHFFESDNSLDHFFQE